MSPVICAASDHRSFGHRGDQHRRPRVKRLRTMTRGPTKFNALTFLYFLIPVRGHDNVPRPHLSHSKRLAIDAFPGDTFDI